MQSILNLFYVNARVTMMGAVCLFLGVSWTNITRPPANPGSTAFPDTSRRDDAAAQAAFRKAYRVFISPRCMNCHPDGNAPLQGDDSHPHAFQVQRGVDGKGLAGMRCGNCHQHENQTGLHMPPGAEDWGLPPAKTPMVFQNKTPRELCEQFKNATKTGGRTASEVIEHLSTELVLWAWEPGEGRTQPPLTHDAFVRELKTWVDKGCACPE
jgi:hypothetical protein